MGIKISSLNSDVAPTFDDLLVSVNDPAGTPASKRVAISALAALVGYPCQGRLTTESGVPVSTSDRTAQGTIYFTPYNGNTVALYTSGAWKLYTFTERSLALTVTSGKNYDVFLYDNAGTLTLELSAAWTTDTARADAIATQDGIKVKSGASDRRLIGTIRASGANVTEDSGGGVTTQVGGKRFVWNLYNQVRRWLRVVDTTDNWTYNTDTWRVADGATAPLNCFEWVTGDVASPVEINLYGVVAGNTNGANAPKVSIGLGNTTPVGLWTVGYNGMVGTAWFGIPASYKGMPGLGYRDARWLEKGGSAGTTFQGDAGAINVQSGMDGTIWN